ncbi:anti-sigma factor family protein [Pirellulaceae bacterium SH449]
MKDNEIPFDESLVSAYVDGELTAEEAEVVESAIQDSPALRQLARELAAVRSLVAASAVKEVALSRSLQSTEWSAPASKLSADHVAIYNSAGDSRKHRKWLGLLASLAAVCLVFLSVRFFADGVRDGGMQIAMEPGFDARKRSGVESEIESFSANETGGVGTSEDVAPSAAAAPMMAEAFSAQRNAMANSMTNSMDASMPSEPLSQNAQDFVGFLTRKLNSNQSVENGQTPLQWNILVVNSEKQPDAFAKEIEATDRVAASSDAAEADAAVVASVAGSGSPAVNNILVFATDSEDEIELQLPETQFSVLLAALEQDPALGNESVLVAVGSVPAEVPKSAKDETVREMVAESTIGSEDSIWRFSRSAEVSSDTLFASGDAPQSGGYGGGYGGGDMLRSESLATGGSSRTSAPGSASPMTLKSRAMRSDGGTRGQVEFNDSAKTAASLGAGNGGMGAGYGGMGAGYGGFVPQEAPTTEVEKLKRIRIKIKKESTSSGSDE